MIRGPIGFWEVMHTVCDRVDVALADLRFLVQHLRDPNSDVWTIQPPLREATAMPVVQIGLRGVMQIYFHQRERIRQLMKRETVQTIMQRNLPEYLPLVKEYVKDVGEPAVPRSVCGAIQMVLLKYTSGELRNEAVAMQDRLHLADVIEGLLDS